VREPDTDVRDASGATAPGLRRLGEPVPEVFPPDREAARFAVAMSIARNDIGRALDDVVDARRETSQDLSYRVRLTIGQLAAALATLDAYVQRSAEVRALVDRVPAAERGKLDGAAKALERADALTPDERLRTGIAALRGRAVEYRYDGDAEALTMAFADEVALAVTPGRGADRSAEALAEVARDAAIAFHAWATALIATYLDTPERAIAAGQRRPRLHVT
jgi:hypothetical protein